MLNCPNCGAPLDVTQNKCAYCGTSYFDLTCIPMNEPFYLRLNVRSRENPQVLCNKVITTGVTLSNFPDSLGCYRNCDGEIMHSFVLPHIEYSMTFKVLNGGKNEHRTSRS